MITKEKWAELVKEWESVGPVYQIPRRSKDRLKHFCEVAALLYGLSSSPRKSDLN